MYFISVDIGTQSTRAALSDEKGKIVSAFSVPSTLHQAEQGEIWQDPEEILENCIHSIREVTNLQPQLAKKVEMICIDGQMAGIMGIGKDGRAVTPYDSWLDKRCEKYAEQLRKMGEDEIIKQTGTPIISAHGPKILWWKQERPEIYRIIAKFVPISSYITMRLCGLQAEDAYLDITHLHFAGFADIKEKRWVSDLIRSVDLDKNKLPQIVKPFEIAGRLTRSAAEKIGLTQGIPLVYGCGDTAACILGAGVTESGTLIDVAGTASVFGCATDIFSPDVANKTILFAPSVIEDLYIPMAYIAGGGMCLKWYRDMVLHGEKTYQELDKAVENYPCGSLGLLFIPHFSGRTCPNDTNVQGTWLRLNWRHDYRHLYRSILESIAYEYDMYYNIIIQLMEKQITGQYVVSVGGGSRSEIMCQIKADVLGLPVRTVTYF